MDETAKLPRYIEVDSTLEFSRLVCAFEHAPRISFLHDHEGRKVISVQMDLLKDRPIIYYAAVNKNVGDYICYGFDRGIEEHNIVSSASDNSKAYSPIVRIRRMPDKLKAGNGTNDAYSPIELEDLASLAKLNYGFDDAPFPLFLFPVDGRWFVGMFTTFNDDGSAYFCYVTLDDEPSGPFLKYATNNGTAPSFVRDPAEHGYSYIKTIKLKYPHPLVNYGEFQD